MRYEGIQLEVNLIKDYEKLKTECNEWSIKNNLSDTSKEYNLKKGDIITIRAGYYDHIAYTVKILGFDKVTDCVYLYWDCYWFPKDLRTHLLDVHVKTILSNV